MKRIPGVTGMGWVIFLVLTGYLAICRADSLQSMFATPTDSARPGVYWYFMDGNQDRDEMTADLESMKKAGIGSVLFLEVNIGVPAGPVAFMSEPWQSNLVHAVRTTERLGMEFILGTGPGWAGSGGSWVTPEDSMQHLVGSSTRIKGPSLFDQKLPVPPPHPANHFAGMNAEHQAIRDRWYRDEAVIAFPTPPEEIAAVDDSALKTLKDVRPYSIRMTHTRFVMPQAEYPEPVSSKVIDAARVIDLTAKMRPDGTLRWEVPAGDWTVMRFATRSTGQTTRPAPRAGHGFECDKFNADAYRRHWENFQKRLLDRLGPRTPGRGLTTIHLDSWEMSSQNWSGAFREEFIKRRGYDPQPWYPAYMGMVVGTLEMTERFLWDMRKTSQELVLENHAGAIKAIAHENGLLYSNEPYDMNPAGDLDLGSIADIPACEFWNAAGGPDTQYSCIEAVSIAHTMGKAQVNAEAFTTSGMQYLNYPGSMKNQTDWALAMGINGIIFHTFQHQPLGEDVKPGMTMGPYGVQWHRNRTMWNHFSGYHEYIARCSHLLRQGVAVADILYMTPEGAPHIFAAPESALAGSPRLKDKRGYNFDAVSARILTMRAKVENGKIVFPGGTSYSLMVLPDVETMTPETLRTIIRLVQEGATVIGNPPRKSPSLVGYPECDKEVQQLAAELWGSELKTERRVGRGRILLNPAAKRIASAKPLPDALAAAARWIWFNRGNPAHDAAAGDVRFRYSWDIVDVGRVQRAFVEASADNSFNLTVNGKQVLSGDNWERVGKADILPVLRNGNNTVEALATNGASTERNPAGFIAALTLVDIDGDIEQIVSDQNWQASLDNKIWSAAKNLGDASMGPWGLAAKRRTGVSEKTSDLYPEYKVAAGVLKDMKLAEDFCSDGPIRYGHRQTDDSDIYFVANTTGTEVKANCDFRVVQGRPQLWDPVTAEMRALPQFTRRDNLTSVPMTLAPHQSFFVVFPRSPSKPKAMAGVLNVPETKSMVTIEGPWDVAFDAKWGGPEKVTFDSLTDWTSHADSGIRYYSGIALYRRSFHYSQGAGKKLFLDLGVVNDIARVRLNGRDIGVLWTAPWRVEITDVVRAQDNQLEIEVVNRWVNRLIGDQQPEDRDVRDLSWPSGLLAGRSCKAGRYTYTTHNPYKADSALLPSGLLGPVRLLSAD